MYVDSVCIFTAENVHFSLEVTRNLISSGRNSGEIIAANIRMKSDRVWIKSDINLSDNCCALVAFVKLKTIFNNLNKTRVL